MMKLTDDDFLRLVTYMKQNYGINLSKKRVLIEGRLSNMVAEMGYSDFRLRLFHGAARIQLPRSQFAKAAAEADAIRAALGSRFDTVLLDLKGR